MNQKTNRPQAIRHLRARQAEKHLLRSPRWASSRLAGVFAALSFGCYLRCTVPAESKDWSSLQTKVSTLDQTPRLQARPLHERRSCARQVRQRYCPASKVDDIEDTEITRRKTVFLCELCALCGERGWFQLLASSVRHPVLRCSAAKKMAVGRRPEGSWSLPWEGRLRGHP